MDNRIRPINLFSLAPLDPYCVISSLYTDPYVPFELVHVSVDMLNSLRSVKHQFPEHMRELLDDFCAVVFGGQGLFSNSSCYLVGAPIRAWQWNIFKEVRWRVANGGDRVEIIKELKEVCEAEDMDKVNTLMETLNSTWQEISTKLYQQTEPEQPEPDNPSDEVTDVEYEEVKE